MLKDDYDILEETRSAAVRSAANLLQAADHAKRIRKRFVSTLSLRDDEDEPAGRARGDFLFDLMRLNAGFLNEMAKLGKKHNPIAHQALERLYGLLVPGGRRAQGRELLFTREERTVPFEVHNDVDPDAEEAMVEWTPLEPPLDKESRNWIESIAGKKISLDRKTPTAVIPWRFGRTEVIPLTVRDFPMARKYTAELVVHAGAIRQRIPVVIDWRAGSREEVLVFRRSQPTARFEIHNEVEPDAKTARVTWNAVRPAVGAASRYWVAAVGKIKVGPGTHAATVPSPHGVTQVIAVTVGDLPVARKYASEIVVELGAARRVIPVVIDWSKR
jgi:hypothetical protein